MIRLGVNIDHVATLREARKEGIPDIVDAANAVAAGGADSITIHLRQDRRHINDEDLYRLKREDILPLNLEMAAVDEIKEIALKICPESVCLVPENRQELTTEGGLDVSGNLVKLRPVIEELKNKGIEVSLFIDPDPEQIEASARSGADAVELHTGKYANASGQEKGLELNKLQVAAALGLEKRLKVNAGHGLDYENVAAITKIPGISDLNIGYSIVCRSVLTGLEQAVRQMKEILLGTFGETSGGTFERKSGEIFGRNFGRKK
ncbi:MAG: pyridoxine 5'-phosphate synthase [Elusimicrobiota bacterium]